MKLQVTLKDLDGTVVNLTSGTTELIYWFERGARTKVAATQDTPASGIASYTFPAGGIPQHGTLYWLWKHTDTSGLPYHTKEIWQQKVRRIPA